jgi:hypothetical protein
MTKKKGQKDKQHNGKKKGTEGQATKWPKKGDRRTSKCHFLLAIVLLVLLSFSFGHCVACPSVIFFWSLCCLSFCSFSFGHCVKKHNGQMKRTEGQETQWPKEKGQKEKQHNDQNKGTEGQATQWPKEQGLSFCYFLLVIVLLVLSFSLGHCVAYPSVSFF